MSALDPIHAAIAVAEVANAAHTASLVGLDEEDDAQMWRANAAAHAASVAFDAVQQTMPATLSGLLVLTEFYARDAELYERSSRGGAYLRHIASALAVLVAQTPAVEANLIDLARMYGGVCGDLWVHRHLLEGVLDEAGALS